jgi:hypothetical protein
MRCPLGFPWPHQIMFPWLTAQITVGSVVAYDQLGQFCPQLCPSVQHSPGHIIGA